MGEVDVGRLPPSYSADTIDPLLTSLAQGVLLLVALGLSSLEVVLMHLLFGRRGT